MKPTALEEKTLQIAPVDPELGCGFYVLTKGLVLPGPSSTLHRKRRLEENGPLTEDQRPVHGGSLKAQVHALRFLAAC